MRLAGVSEEHIKKTESRLRRISEDLCYSCNYHDIIIYINELKRDLAPPTYRKYILDLRRILNEIYVLFANDLRLPPMPKRRKLVIRPKHLEKLIRQAENLSKSKYLRLRAAILLSATSGLRSEELYSLRRNDIDVDDRMIYVRAEITKDYEDRITFFSEETSEALKDYLRTTANRPFIKDTIIKDFRKLDVRVGRTPLRMKHIRKFFSQQSDRLGMPTAVKKILMGHSLRGDIDLSHYDFQDEEELKKIYDKYWRDFRILSLWE